MKQTKKYLITGITILILIVAGYSVRYLTSSLQPTESETNLYQISQVEEAKDWFYFPANTESNRAVILYQGAKVEAKAYTSLATEIQHKGYHVFISKMPFNIAFFDKTIATKIINIYPEITDFYIGGHSLGGVVAADYVYKNQDNNKIKGLYFLASYPNKDFSKTDIPMLAIFAENDGLIDIGKRQEYKSNSSHSEDNVFVILKGANHAQFGNYGNQKGDNAPTIPLHQQHSETAKLIDQWIMKVENSVNE